MTLDIVVPVILWMKQYVKRQEELFFKKDKKGNIIGDNKKTLHKAKHIESQ